MKSLKFPNFLNSSSSAVVEDSDATCQNLKLLLLSTKKEFAFDPYFGTKLKQFLFDQNNYVIRDVVIDDIYEAIALFMPQLTCTRKDITIAKGKEKASVVITIKARNMTNYKLNTYNLVLLSEDINA